MRSKNNYPLGQLFSCGSHLKCFRFPVNKCAGISQGEVMIQAVHPTYQAKAADRIASRGIVAVVEDDPDISRALGMWLELNGLRATHHISGESLMQAIHQEADGLTLQISGNDPVVFPLIGAVLDLNLPGMTGIELATRLRQLAPGLPLTIITALRDDECSRYGKLPPGMRCLQKPFDLNALEDALFPLLS
jgi:CheY-like chemotaxis protein